MWRLRSDHALGLGQSRCQDPHQLRRRRRAHPGPRVRQPVLDRRVRQAEAMGGRLLRASGQDRCHHPDLAVGGALGDRPISPDAGPHASPLRRRDPSIPTLDRDLEGCWRAPTTLRASHCHESQHGREMSRDIGATCVTRSLETPAIGVTLVAASPWTSAAQFPSSVCCSWAPDALRASHVVSR